jgi:uncharacterized membrane protein
MKLINLLSIVFATPVVLNNPLDISKVAQSDNLILDASTMPTEPQYRGGYRGGYYGGRYRGGYSRGYYRGGF